MSFLKFYIYSIITVIFEYTAMEIGTSQYKRDYLQLIKLSDQALTKELEQCIAVIEKKHTSNRVSFLNYLKSLSIDVKKLIDKEQALTEKEEDFLQQQLIYLLKNCHLLLNSSSKNHFTISYGKETFRVFGFQGLRTCKFKEALENTFFNNNAALPAKFNPNEKTELPKLTAILQELIQTHQAPFKLKEEIESLKTGHEKNIASLKAQVDSVKQKNQTLQKEHDQLNETLSTMRATYAQWRARSGLFGYQFKNSSSSGDLLMAGSPHHQ